MPARRIAARAVALAACSLLLAAGCDLRDGGGAGEAEVAALSGAELAERHCTGCHLLPEPGMLPRASWEREVLPRMGYRLGIYDRPGVREDSLIEPGEAGEIVRAAGIFPERPQISRAAWEKLVAHYLSGAPAALPPQPPHPPARAGLTRFRVRVPAFRTDPPMTSLVKIDAARGRIFLGDVKQDYSTLEILDLDFQPIQTIGVESAPSDVRVVGDSVQLLLMGRMLPTDAPSGLLRMLFRAEGAPEYNAAIRLVDGLFRPVAVTYADLNGDAREDLVVSEFGHLVGRLAWYEQLPDQTYALHVLRPLPGALTNLVRDLDADGDPDILALFGQGDEGVYLYRNQGGGRFQEERLLRLPPTYGSISMELHDFNGDGHVDILHSGGDNGDFYPIPKPYHGVRIFLNDGENRFAEAYHYPLYGAFKASAHDFDQDGDLDIAAVAFYPEYRRPPAEGFVYLENRGGLAFAPSTFPGVDRGRWITFDTGDLDRDGDRDIVLGSFVAFDPTGDTTGLRGRWLREGPSVIVLENTTR